MELRSQPSKSAAKANAARRTGAIIYCGKRSLNDPVSPGFPVISVPYLPLISQADILDLMNEVTRILNAIEQGEPHAAEKLLPLVYDELRQLAAARMAQEKPGQTLDATGLVHEAYIRLIGPADDRRWDERGHFFAAAAEAMRRILVESARRKKRLRHGGGLRRAELPGDGPAILCALDDVVAVNEALDKLAAADAQAAELVKLHYFAGLTIAQTAHLLGVSVRKAYAVWAYARAWLFRCLEGEAPPGP
jgi:RNA polymerase sigma factor (TIGR02999 family)